MNKGDLLIIPTDTVYGLAARLFDDKGLEKIYALKGRDPSKPIPILISDIDQLEDIAVFDEFTRKVMETFWPGPLTLVLDTTEKFKRSTREETIAVRMPNHPKALNVIKRAGVLRVTSLNKSGEEPLEDRDEIRQLFGDDVVAIFWKKENEKKTQNLSSTVAKIKDDMVDILREGMITKEDILSLRANRIEF